MKIIETALVKVLVEVGDDEEIKFIKDKGGNDVVINSDNADYQWQVFDKKRVHGMTSLEQKGQF